MERQLIELKMKAYIRHLETEEKSAATRKQYIRDIRRFFLFLEGETCTKDSVLRYKESLQSQYLASGVNTKLAALNGFFAFIGREDLKVRLLKIQQRVYSPKEKELTKQEYFRLVRTAKKQNRERLSLLIQTICGTGIRVSELVFITTEAVRRGEAVVRLKGKTRVIFLPDGLRKALKRYVFREGVVSGPVFVTRSGTPLDRSNIWKMMKSLCREAGVDEGKVFPHNLRHLFARTFYEADKDIAKLADVLGHSSISTTRIYIMSSGREHRRQMEHLGLLL